MTITKEELQKILTDHPNASDQAAAINKLVSEQQQNSDSSSNSLLSMLSGQSKAARDPVEVMQDVFKNQTYTDREKNLLFFMSRQRFENRRKMAYYSLSMLIGGAILIAAAMIYDGIHPLVCTDTDIPIEGCTQKQLFFRYTAIIKANTEALSWIGGFFTSVIALYYGASSLRPTS